MCDRQWFTQKQAMTSTLLLALVAIVFIPNNVKTISVFMVILH